MNTIKKWVYVASFDGKKVRKFIVPAEELRQYKWINRTKFRFPDNDGHYCEGIMLYADDDEKVLQEEIKNKNFRCPHNAFHPFPDQDAKLEPDELSSILKNSKKRLANEIAHDHSSDKRQKKLSILNVSMDENSMNQESKKTDRNSTLKGNSPIADPAQASTSMQQSDIIKSMKDSLLEGARLSMASMSSDEKSDDQINKPKKVSWRFNESRSGQSSVESNPITTRRSSIIKSQFTHSGVTANQLCCSPDNNSNTIKDKSFVPNKMKVSKRVIPYSMNSVVKMELKHGDPANEMMVRTEKKYVELKEKYKLLERKYEELQSELAFRQQHDVEIKYLSKSIYGIIRMFEKRCLQ